MKVLAVMEFDPCGVMAGWRKHLRMLGIDFRIAVETVYGRHLDQLAWDYEPAITEGLLSFAEEADVIQFHPGIGQPWSFKSTIYQVGNDADEHPFAGIDWRKVKTNAVRVAYFHGSRNTAAHAAEYAAYYRSRGMQIWTSTADYVTWMGATYAPPVIELTGEPVPLRTDRDPLTIVHAPTDPENCYTEAFLALAGRLGLPVTLVQNKSHAETIAAKRTCNAGFDHLRGAFSINTIENAALGLVPFVGLTRENEDAMRMQGFHAPAIPPITTLDDLATWLEALDNDVDSTRAFQIAAREWYSDHFSPEALVPRIAGLYRGLLNEHGTHQNGVAR